MCTAKALHIYLSQPQGAGLPHICVCTKTAQIIQGLKKNKSLGPFFSALFSPSIQAPRQQARLLCPSEKAQKASLSQRQEEAALLTELPLDLV